MEKEERKEIIIVAIRLVLALGLALLGLFWLNEANFGVYVNLLVMAIAWLIVGYDIIFKAIRSLFEEKNPFDENMLMLLASIGAFSLRAFGKDEDGWLGNEFFEAVMIAFLYQLGELFEDLAAEKSHKAIADAVGLRAKTANLLVDGVLTSVDPTKLSIGDVILVKVGEIIPADGTIIEGYGDVDASSLTGEFNPELKKAGEAVNAGTILKTGSLTVKVERSYEDSTVSKIIALVEEGSSSKSKADKFITRFSKIYTPIVVGLAFLVAIIPPLFIGYSNGLVWKEYLKYAVSLLVISCPCAVVISVPLAYFAGIGLAGKNGIIVKGGIYFDRLNDLGVLVTDKTGTLTKGRFVVEKEEPLIDAVKFEEYLLAAESKSNHPIAKAIIGSKDVSKHLSKISDYHEKAGYGSILVYDGHRVMAGNAKLMKDESIAFEEAKDEGTIVYLAVDGSYAGKVLLNDEIKDKSKATIRALNSLGIKTVMLTGDKKENALKVGSFLEIQEIHAELLPQDKQETLKGYLGQEKAIAYVGDGINDAPSIILSDIGFAMGGIGSDLAIENADIVIMNDDISKVVAAIKIAKATRRRAIFNVIASLAIKFGIALSCFLIPNFPLMVAVLADTGVALLMILSSLSLLSKKVKAP